MPKQVDRTKREPVRTTPVASTSEAVELLSSGNVQPSADPPAQQPTTTSTADDKIYKSHVMKLKSLAKPIDPKVPRADGCAVEWGIDEKREKLDAWLAGGKYAPSTAAAALSESKPERIWIPLVRHLPTELTPDHAWRQAPRHSEVQIQAPTRKRMTFPRRTDSRISPSSASPCVPDRAPPYPSTSPDP